MCITSLTAETPPPALWEGEEEEDMGSDDDASVILRTPLAKSKTLARSTLGNVLLTSLPPFPLTLQTKNLMWSQPSSLSACTTRRACRVRTIQDSFKKRRIPYSAFPFSHPGKNPVASSRRT